MDGSRQSFSGVINALHVKHPSVIALSLQGAGSPRDHATRSAGLGAGTQPARGRPRDARTTGDSGAAKRSVASTRSAASFATLAASSPPGTSTGGRSFEFPGRVSDSATVAGNYASEILAVSAAGIGEEIIDDALAARLETRCRDGMPLEQAARRCFDEAVARGRTYGWIAVHRNGDWVSATPPRP